MRDTTEGRVSENANGVSRERRQERAAFSPTFLHERFAREVSEPEWKKVVVNQLLRAELDE